MTTLFLQLDEILILHARQIKRFGGKDGIRDQGLLESALSQPESMFAGTYLHQPPFETAAAYLFHLVSNHPFVDGNKRIGLVSALVFLNLNGIKIRKGTQRLYELTMAVAQGRLAKEEIAGELEALATAG